MIGSTSKSECHLLPVPWRTEYQPDPLLLVLGSDSRVLAASQYQVLFGHLFVCLSMPCSTSICSRERLVPCARCFVHDRPGSSQPLPRWVDSLLLRENFSKRLYY